LLHRHVALLVVDRDGMNGRVRQWVRDLAAASPRAHLLVIVSVGGGKPPASLSCVGVDPDSEGRARRWSARGGLEWAEATIASAVALAELAGVAPPPWAAECLQHVRRRQGRFEEAAAWTQRRGSMGSLQHVSALLQLVHDAEDEHAALRHGCAWVRE